MRKTLVYTALSGLLITAITGCLKDKDFEDQEYGLQVKEVKAVSFPAATGGPIPTGIVSSSTPLTIDGPTIALEAEGVASTDVRVTVQVDDALVAEANTEYNLTMVPLPVTAFSLSSLTPTVSAGTRLSDALKITFANTAALDASKTYGLGLRIVSADNGYGVARNMRSVVLAINVKNAYANDYDVTGNFFHPSAPRAIDDVKTLVTLSPVRSRAPHSDLYASNYYFDFDVSATNTLVNYAPAGATPNGGFMTLDNPGGAPFPVSPVQPGAAPWLASTYNNTYVPASKTFWMHYGYVASGSTNQNDYSRQVYEKWVGH